MGILRLFSYLSRKYPNICANYFNPYYKDKTTRKTLINTKVENYYQPKCDIVMFDLNANIHPVMQKVFDYGSGEEQKSLFWSSKKKEMTYEELELMAFNMLCNEVEKIVRITNPSKCVYIAIDGVPGLSKQAQQRQRRFKGALSSSQNSYGFSSNVITTGTEFMERLCDHIHNWIHKKKQFDYNWKRLKVVYNNMFVPGEGEHKILRFLEENPHFKNITIMSPDADLIMLGLTLKREKITILRENVFKYINADYIFVDVNELRNCILHDIRCENLEHLFQDELAIRDYVFFSFMIGNDFLPNVPSLEISNKGIETLYYTYTTTYMSNGYLLQDVNNKIYINKKSFIGLFEELSKLEVKMIMEKWEKGYAKFPDKLLNKHMIRKSGEDVKLDFYEYRKDYYITKLGVSENILEHEIREICKEYIVGMIFVLRYYFKGIPTFDWCYKHHYAPFFSDLHETAKQMANEQQGIEFYDITFTPIKPLSIYESLVGILPPSSFNLLPENISEKIKEKIVLDADFIEEFEIDLDGKQQEYEGICVLPFVTYKKIKELFEGIKLTEQQKEKSKVGNIYVL